MNALITASTVHGQPVVGIRTRDGAQAMISLFGAQVLHWQPAGGRPWIYLSETACYDGSRAIRGGIPVCFPQFAQQGSLSKHGLVRTLSWRVIEQRTDDNHAMLTLGYDSNGETTPLWPHSFSLELTVGLGANRLDVELEVTNTGHAGFGFTAALHTYLRVAEVELVQLEGLGGLEYVDALDGGALKREAGGALAIDGPVDRIYRGATRPLMLTDGDRRLQIVQEHFPDVVVWNPWEDGAAALDDMPDSDFRRMLCVEAALAAERMELSADATFWARQSLIEVP